MSDLSVQLRVTSVRSCGRFGGVIFSGKTDEGDQYVAVCDYKLVPDPSLVDKGQRWAVRGIPTQRESIGSNGFKFSEAQIEATEAELVLPSGRNVIAWIAECPDIQGIGKARAHKLYERFGPTLIDHINCKNIGALADVVGGEAAEKLCHAFTKHQVAHTLLWLDRLGIQRRIGKKVTDFYKDMAQNKIEANPYVLISFEASWKTVDQLARQRFGIALDDPRRLDAAIEESLHRGLKDGHTCLPESQLKTRLSTLLGNSYEHANQALTSGASSAQYRKFNGVYQATGAFLIESYIANRLHELLAGEATESQAELLSRRSGDLRNVYSILDAYERAHGIPLSDEQRHAVLNSAGTHLSLILGGAVTGKATVLKALYEVLETLQPGQAIFQLALAGPAAQRMAEATGRESMTIAEFLDKVDPVTIEMGSTIVVDEASVVDVILMYRLLRHLPSSARLILVGDSSRLPPIGPGLVLHALSGLPSIPQTELKVVKLQSSASGILQVAAAIRNHQSPTWANFTGQPGSGVSFVSCAPASLEETVCKVYGELGGTGEDYSVQILSITNAGPAGVKQLNGVILGHYRQRAELVYCHDAEFGKAGATTHDREPLKVGDLIIYTENDNALGLRNGSLGKVISALPVGGPNEPCCVCDFEGTEYRLNSNQMNALKHSYSITVHRSQDSQFRRVIVPIRESRLLDQTLIYTAVTRGVEQVVLVGDEEATMRAIKAPASAARRHITLPLLLEETV